MQEKSCSRGNEESSQLNRRIRIDDEEEKNDFVVPDYADWKRGVVTEVSRLPPKKFCFSVAILAVTILGYAFGEQFGPWFVLCLALMVVVFAAIAMRRGSIDYDAKKQDGEVESSDQPR
jgi:hypothetical protein